MDINSFLGLLIGFGAILVGQHLEGGHLHTLLNFPAFLIVMGGTMGAVVLESPPKVFLRAWRLFFWVYFPPKTDLSAGINKVVGWATIARKEGLLGLEKVIEEQEDLFEKKSLQLLVDGSDPHAIRHILEVEIESAEKMNGMAAKVFESFGGYSPTIGIIGAVMGLIHVMGNLSDPSKLGSGIAVAFVATIYGVAVANLIFLPTANKIKKYIEFIVKYQEMMIEGVVSIAEGENPRIIEMKMQGYVV